MRYTTFKQKDLYQANFVCWIQKQHYFVCFWPFLLNSLCKVIHGSLGQLRIIQTTGKQQVTAPIEDFAGLVPIIFLPLHFSNNIMQKLNDLFLVKFQDMLHWNPLPNLLIPALPHFGDMQNGREEVQYRWRTQPAQKGIIFNTVRVMQKYLLYSKIH